jgi:hypothetical protein
MKNIGQGSLFDEPGESKPGHRFHATPRGDRSLDVGPIRRRRKKRQEESDAGKTRGHKRMPFAKVVATMVRLNA